MGTFWYAHLCLLHLQHRVYHKYVTMSQSLHLVVTVTAGKGGDWLWMWSCCGTAQRIRHLCHSPEGPLNLLSSDHCCKVGTWPKCTQSYIYKHLWHELREHFRSFSLEQILIFALWCAQYWYWCSSCPQNIIHIQGGYVQYWWKRPASQLLVFDSIDCRMLLHKSPLWLCHQVPVV